MQVTTQKYLNRIGDTTTWLDEPTRAQRLAQVTAYPALRAKLGADKTAIETAFLAQSQSGGGAQQGVILKSGLLHDMLHDIEILARAARAIALTTPGFETAFVLPTSWGETAIAGAARTFAANLQIQSNLDAFLSMGMDANTPTELAQDSALYDQYFKDKAGKTQARIEDGTDLDAAIIASSQTIDILDGIIHLVYGNNKTVIGSWKEAKRLEKMRAHRAAVTP